MKFLRHLAFVLIGLFIILGIPSFFFSDWSHVGSFSNEVDAVTGASLEVPDQPSGNYYVFLNTTYHPKTTAEWRNFFEEKPVDVIMEDLSCQVIGSDAGGIELAQRYQARLAENQMKLKTEDTTLVASKIETGVFDVAIVSREVAELLPLKDVFSNGDVMTVSVEGQAE